MLKLMKIKNLTVFANANLEFSAGLNVIVGENGAGKSHLLKMAYSVLAVSAEEGRKPNNSVPTKSILQTRLADKLVNVFRPETLGRLARRNSGRVRSEIELVFAETAQNISFSFATQSKSEVNIEQLPISWVETPPVYFPTRELLTIYPNFVSVYNGHYLDFEETWYDTCLLLGALMPKGNKEKQIKKLLTPLETAMQGSIELDKNGRFYLKGKEGRMEMPLVAEGLRKLGMLSRLIATGALFDNGYLFWDEPEANLNPRLIKDIACSILDVAASGIQVVIATHSLFLLRELQILKATPEYKKVQTRYFGLSKEDDGVIVQQGNVIEDIGDISALDEDLAQSDRYLALP